MYCTRAHSFACQLYTHKQKNSLKNEANILTSRTVIGNEQHQSAFLFVAIAQAAGPVLKEGFLETLEALDSIP